LCDALLEIPIRPQYADDARGPLRSPPTSEDQRSAPRVAAIRTELDNRVWSEVLLLERNQLYEITIRGETASISPDVVRILVQPSSTLPKHAYDLALDDCVLSPERNTFEVTGTLSFSCTKSVLQDPVSFKLHVLARDKQGRKWALKNLGEDELRAHVIGASSVSSLVTAGLVGALRRKWSELSPVPGDELERELNSAFSTLVTLGEFQLYCYQRAVLGKNADESQLQAEILRFLDAKYPGEAVEHSDVAGGETDVVFRGMKIELKVERETSDRDRIAEKYAKQVGQYSAGSFRLLSAIVVLDLTSKRAAPPADVRNDIRVVDIPTHGLEGRPRYPSKAWIFVVAGNLERPSAYSS